MTNRQERFRIQINHFLDNLRKTEMFYENAFQNIATVTPLSIRLDCTHKSGMIYFWQHLDSSKIMLKLCSFLWITLLTIAIEVWLFSKLETKQFEQRQNSDCRSVFSKVPIMCRNISTYLEQLCPHFLLGGPSVVILSSSTSASPGKSLIKELSLEYILSASAGDSEYLSF